ncbi:VanZ family protein [Neobacillus niacini]|uniref:VanZ family protein n=1 Tax=Neobacillus niacini TaxID=86668 RepID=UPI00203BE69E|nr:VanZ family protein [Neobacillus niacini]MCM3691313.1 VanZ family protein [Neobacillus niacini]
MKISFLVSLIVAIALSVILSPFLIQLVVYLHPVVLGVILFCLVLAIFFGILFIRKQTIPLPYSKVRLLLLLYTIALFILLFFRPSDQSYQSINLVPFSTISFYLSGKVTGLISFYNLAANIALFIPFGIFLKMNERTIYQFLYIPILFISLIEFLQYLSARGSLDIDDLLLNVLGFFIGYIVYPIFIKVFKVSLQK